MKNKKINSYAKMAMAASEASPDTQTKVGCILIDADGHVLGTGFNGFLRGAIDSELPTKRPEKYKYMLHAELNAILNCARVGSRLKGATAFITLSPCVQCTRALFQCGVNTIYFLKSHGSFNETYGAEDFSFKLSYVQVDNELGIYKMDRVLDSGDTHK